MPVVKPMSAHIDLALSILDEEVVEVVVVVEVSADGACDTELPEAKLTSSQTPQIGPDAS